MKKMPTKKTKSPLQTFIPNYFHCLWFLSWCVLLVVPLFLILVFFCSFFFFFNDTATTEIYTLSLHDALPISAHSHRRHASPPPSRRCRRRRARSPRSWRPRAAIRTHGRDRRHRPDAYDSRSGRA